MVQDSRAPAGTILDAVKLDIRRVETRAEKSKAERIQTARIRAGQIITNLAAGSLRVSAGPTQYYLYFRSERLRCPVTHSGLILHARYHLCCNISEVPALPGDSRVARYQGHIPQVSVGADSSIESSRRSEMNKTIELCLKLRRDAH